MKNKNVLIAGWIVVSLVLLGGGYYVFSLSTQKPSPVAAQSEIQEKVVPTVVPKELGLILSARADKKAVKFAISNVSGITSVEYEITYVAAGDIPRGVIGILEPTAGKLESKYIDLGTCSSGKCKYDAGVTSVKFLLKITKTDGKIYQAEDTLSL